jgi:hypothetical protein
MVETVDIELAAHHAVFETSLLLSQEREFSLQRRRAGIDQFAQNSEAETALVREFTAHVFEISAVLRVIQKLTQLRRVGDRDLDQTGCSHAVNEPVSSVEALGEGEEEEAPCDVPRDGRARIRPHKSRVASVFAKHFDFLRV